MRIGVRLGPVSVSASDRRRRASGPRFTWWPLLLFLVLLFWGWLGDSVALWTLWIGVPVLAAGELVHRSRKRR
jgi:hypothetical protein